jgi:hypothetical protein
MYNYLIVQAYSKYSIWNEVKKYTNKKGWCRVNYKYYPEIEKQYCDMKPHWWRPIELKGKVF